MFKRNLILAAVAAGSLAVAQGALASQPAELGFDPYHVFGHARTVAASASHTPVNPFGFDPYNVPGTYAGQRAAAAGPMQTARELANPFGEQAGA